jgi:hypothetical protein
MRYAPLNVPASYPIAAIYRNTAPAETSPFVMPGNYTVKLIIDGRILSQPLTIKVDPRVKTGMSALQKQHDLSVTCYEARKTCLNALAEIRGMRAQLREKPGTDNAKMKDDQLVLLETGLPGGEGASFSRLSLTFSTLLNILQDADMAPTSQVVTAVNETQVLLKEMVRRLNRFKQQQ